MWYTCRVCKIEVTHNVTPSHKYRRANNLERKEVIRLRIFFRKLLRMYVPECRFECENNTDENYCGAQGNKGYYTCTRIKGHKGNHVACGTEDHELYVWED